MKLPWGKIIDPVCGKRVAPDNYYYCQEHEGNLYRFCSADCWSRFRHDPETYVSKLKNNRSEPAREEAKAVT